MGNFVFQGEKLKEARKVKGFSQEGLAEAIGVKGNSVSRWEINVSAPRKEALDKLAKLLDKEPSWFYGVEDSESESREYPGSQPSYHPQIQTLIEMLASTDNPLDYDRMLWDRAQEEFQQVGPGALRTARDYLALSLADVSKVTGITTQRLTDIETRQSMPITADEVMHLRSALGVAFDPRAVAYSGLSLATNVKDRRPAAVRLQESRRIWQTECQRVPNKLDTILARLDQLQRDIDELKKDKGVIK